MKCELRDAATGQFGGHFQTRDHAGRDFILNARVQALGIFSDHHKIHIFKARGHASQTADGADRSIQTKRLAQRDIHAGETRSHRRGAWTFQGHAMLADGGKRGFWQSTFGTALHRGKSGVMSYPLNVHLGGGKNAAYRRGNFGSNTITRNKNCLNCHNIFQREIVRGNQDSIHQQLAT